MPKEPADAMAAAGPSSGLVVLGMAALPE